MKGKIGSTAPIRVTITILVTILVVALVTSFVLDPRLLASFMAGAFVVAFIGLIGIGIHKALWGDHG